MIKRFGKSPNGERLQLLRNSANFKNGSFRNLEKTSLNPNKVSMLTILKKMVFRPKDVKPAGKIPHKKCNLQEIDTQKPAFVWFGHSSYLIQINGFKVLVDPVLSGNASPLRFFGKAFKGANDFRAEDIPDIDLLILTHDHYDHLDYKTITVLHRMVKIIVTPLGVGSHLEEWGVSREKIIELDWWENSSLFPGVEIISTPARHFSGRLFHRGKTLWSSFVLKIFDITIFVGGDSGYDKSFNVIGQKFGPVDLAFLECGQFGEYWPQIHMFPEETVQAGLDLQANLVVPVHWGKFVLSHHPWNEPIQRFVQAAEISELAYLAPQLGELVNFKEIYHQETWWNFESKLDEYEREPATLE